jgi:hypothetical protein
MLTITEGIDGEEKADKPCLFVIANLADLGGAEDPAMSLDLEGPESSERGEMGDLNSAVRQPPLYTVVKFCNGERIRLATFSPFRVSGRHPQSNAPQRRHVVDFE